MNLSVPIRDRGRLDPKNSLRRQQLLLILTGLTLVAFAAVDVRYLGAIFNDSMRWLLLALLLVVLLIRGAIGSGTGGVLGALIAAYCIWVLSSVSWSLVPALSLPKAIVAVLVIFVFTGAGFEWVRRVGERHALTLFAPLSALALLVALVGSSLPEATIDTGSVVIYSGLAYNPNLLGILIIMALPWAMSTYDASRQGKMRKRLFSYLLLATLLAALFFTGARASILAVALAIATYVLCTGFGRNMTIAAVGVLVASAVLTAFPGMIGSLWEIMQKGAGEGGDIFLSRRETWGQSLAGAEQGGWFGLGYGVSAGHANFEGGFTAAGYGREKGNSALAVIEELGVVGFALYLSMLAGVLRTLISAALRAQSREARGSLAIAAGTILGLIANSQFEAWWTAPGAPASPFFWTLVGVSIRMAETQKRNSSQRPPVSSTAAEISRRRRLHARLRQKALERKIKNVSPSSGVRRR